MPQLIRFLFIAAFVMLGAMTPGVSPRAAAQEASPAAGMGVPDPSECVIEPRDRAFFEQYAGTPTAAQEAAMMAEATPPAGFTMPEGEAPDEATEAEVLATIRHLGACLNAGGFFGEYAAFFTEEFLARQFEQFGPIPEEELAFIDAPSEPLPENGRVGLLAVVDIRELPDGRVGVLIDAQDPFIEPPGPSRIYWELVEEDGRWLIDEEIMFGAIDPAQIGTPTP